MPDVRRSARDFSDARGILFSFSGPLCCLSAVTMLLLLWEFHRCGQVSGCCDDLRPARDMQD